MKSSYLALSSSLLLLFMLTLLLIIPSAASELEVSKYSDDSSNLGITSISAKKDVVGLWSTGYTWLNLGINVTNYGNETETFNATFYANSTIIQEISNITVEVQNFTIVVFRGAVAGFAYGNYAISASITPAVNETDFSDNFIDGLWIFVTINGDINADKWVDIYDAIKFAWPIILHPLYYPWYPRDHANADLNDDGEVNIYDAILLAMNFGKHWE